MFYGCVLFLETLVMRDTGGHEMNCKQELLKNIISSKKQLAVHSTVTTPAKSGTRNAFQSNFFLCSLLVNFPQSLNPSAIGNYIDVTSQLHCILGQIEGMSM